MNLKAVFESLNPIALTTVVICLLSYLLGALSFSAFLSKKKTEFWPMRFIGLFVDAVKGSLAVACASTSGFLMISALFGVSTEEATHHSSLWMMWLAGFFAVIGHCYSPFPKFKGGKGVVTGFGVLLVLSPLAAVFGFIGFLLTFFYKRIPSLSSIAGLLLASIAYLVLNPMGAHLWIGAFLVFVILARHEENIDALLEDRERPAF